MPISAPDERTQDRTFRSWLIAVGRMNRDSTLRSAQAEMDVLARGIADAHSASNKDWGVRVESIQEAQFGSWMLRPSECLTIVPKFAKNPRQ